MSDSEFEEDATDSLYKPSFVLIAIDTHPSAFVKYDADNDDKSSLFKSCMDACHEIADSLMFTQNKRSWSPFGVVLVNNDDNAASFVDFKSNVLDTIKFLKEKKQMSNKDLVDNYQRKGDFDFGAFLLYCKKKFKEVSSVFYKRTIIFITNDDDPVQSDKNKRFTALNEAKNFEANDIDFQVVTMNPNFNYSLFYNELFSLMKTPPVEELIEDKEGLVEKLSTSVLMRFTQRKLQFFPVRGDKMRFLQLTQKNFINKVTLYNNSYVTAEGKVVKKIIKTLGDDSMRAYHLNHPSKIPFGIQENFDLFHNDLPIGYTFLHVSSRVTDAGFVLGSGAILEVHHKEELQFFNSFWQYCVDKNKVLVCVRKLKYQDKIRFVELIPKFANNRRLFLVKLIPFSDEIHHPPSKLRVSDDQLVAEHTPQELQVTRDLIQQLTFDYDPKMFVNPVMAKKMAFLKSKFLNEPLEDVEDTTAGTERIDSRISDVAERFHAIFNLEADADKKRKAPRATKAAPKRTKK